jgi:DNA-binding helix-hairpin-helix protein with protein kinase domain
MREFAAGERVKLLYGGECTIIDKIGEGGQGIVYRVNNSGRIMVLKWYIDGKISNPEPFYNNIKENIERGIPASTFLWPKEITEKQFGSFGYLMDLIPPEYIGFNYFLLTKKDGRAVQFSSFNAIMEAGLNIVRAFRTLHQNGYSYQDINDGNFSINSVSGDVLICDNDNVAPYGVNLGIAGKPGYMAPEVVLGIKKPDINTDKFSLAVVLFLLLFMDRPFEGRRNMVPCLTPEKERFFFGEDPVFIMDPDSTVNRPVPGIHQNVIKRWAMYPDFVRNLFIEAFSKEAIQIPSRRVIEKTWQEMFVKLRDAYNICPYCGKMIFYDAMPGLVLCTSCKDHLPEPLYLSTKGYKVPLVSGNVIYRCHIDKASDDYDTKVGLVRSKQDDPFNIGIKNISGEAWEVTRPGEEKKSIATGSTVKVVKGTIITFGNNVANVV